MSPENSRITLVGTIHRDPKGEGALVTLLKQLQPDLVTVEVAPAAVEYRRMRTRPLLFRLERILERLAKEFNQPVAYFAELPIIQDIQQLLALPFEYRAACRYAEQRPTRVELIDLNEISLQKLKHVDPGLINYRNIRTLVNLEQPEIVHHAEGDYVTARNLLAARASDRLRESFLDKRRGDEGIGSRDGHMAATIRQLLAKHRPEHLVHIGGWVHLITDPQGGTLRSQLLDLDPVCYLADRNEPLEQPAQPPSGSSSP